MSKNRVHKNECGPVIACGAATVSLNHDPSEPTSIDMLAAMLKKLFSGKHESITTSGMEGSARKMRESAI